jgi:hypothetical protein
VQISLLYSSKIVIVWGNAIGGEIIGGFCGEIYSEWSGVVARIENCYCVGITNGNKYVRGFCGVGRGNGIKEIKGCYWDIEKSDLSEEGYGTGCTTIEMKTQSTFQNWDFDNVWSIDPNVNDGYPHLRDIYTLDVPHMSFNKHSDLFSIYPNPSSDMITVSTINEDQIFKQIEIVDVTGSVVFKKSDISQYSINIPVQEIPIGVYFVRAYINDQTHIRPFIVNR